MSLTLLNRFLATLEMTFVFAECDRDYIFKFTF